MTKPKKNITKGKTTTEKKDSFSLFDPNFLKKTFDDIKEFLGEEKEAIGNILNKALEEKLLAAAGQNKSSLEKLLKELQLNYEEGFDLDLKGYFNKFILPEAMNDAQFKG